MTSDNQHTDPPTVWQRLRHSERGQGLVEYALIIVVVSLGTIAALTFLRDNIRGLFSAAGSSIALGDGGGSATGTGTGGPATIPVVSAAPVATCSNVANCDDLDTLSTTNGTWSGSPTSYTYQWQEGNDNPNDTCNNVSWSNRSGATSATLDPPHLGNQSSDDYCYRVGVIAHNSAGDSVVSYSSGVYVRSS